MQSWQRELLGELLQTYGPCGQEEAVRDICRRELEPYVDDMWVDAAGNLIGLRRGSQMSEGSARPPVIRVTAHMDELSMLVKRVNDQGELAVSPLGTMYPANFGLGPVAVLGDRETVIGVLTVGSEHTTQESSRIWETKPDGGDKALTWSHLYVFTGRSKEDLLAAGVHPGSRLCIHESKRAIVDLPDYVGSYFIDDRAALVILISAARELVADAGRPPGDVYFVCTTNEEMGGIGASYASSALPGDITLALDVGPAEAEYQTAVDSSPIVVFADDSTTYDRQIANRLLTLGQEIGTGATPAVFESYDSDSSNAKAKGQTAQAALLALPTLSTHGYEVIADETVPKMARLLTAYLRAPLD